MTLYGIQFTGLAYGLILPNSTITLLGCTKSHKYGQNREIWALYGQFSLNARIQGHARTVTRCTGVNICPKKSQTVYPTLAKSTHLLAARARRGGSLAGRVSGNNRAILQRLMREDEEEVEEEENSDSDFSVSSDLGPILNVIL